MVADPDLGIEGLEDAVLIGHGGFGQVFRARQPRLNRSVAVKVLTATLEGPAQERFEREGFAMGTLAGHPNIVQVLGVGTTSSGRPYLLMPYLTAGSLDRVLPLPWERAVAYGVRLCGALATAHEAGVLHRDVKPANVLVSDFGEPLLTDFGIARVSGGFQTSSSVVTASVAFAPPEVLAGAAASVAGDVYSLGATVHALITGAPPVAPRPDEELVSLYRRISLEPPPDLGPWGVPADVGEVLAQALAKDPADRPPSAEALGRALQEAQQANGSEVTPMALPRRDDQATPAASAVAATLPETQEASPPGAVLAHRTTRRGPTVALACGLALVLALTSWLLADRLRGAPDGRRSSDGAAADAALAKPVGLALGPEGDLYVADEERHQVLRLNQDGAASVVAGTGTSGNTGDGGPATEATLSFPSDVAFGPDGQLYVTTGGTVRVVGRDGVIAPVTGLPDIGPRRLVVDGAGNLYLADKESVWRRGPDGEVARVLGPGVLGSVGDIALDPRGRLVVSDPDGHVIVRVDRGRTTRIAGLGSDAGAPQSDGYPARESAVLAPVGLTVATDGGLYFSEYGNNRVRMVRADGTVRTVAGSPDGYAAGDDAGDEGPGRAARLSLGDGPLAVAEDGTLFIGDIGNGRVRRLDPAGTIHAFG